MVSHVMRSVLALPEQVRALDEAGVRQTLEASRDDWYASRPGDS